MKGSLLGPNFLNKDIEKILNKAGQYFINLMMKKLYTRP